MFKKIFNIIENYYYRCTTKVDWIDLDFYDDDFFLIDLERDLIV